MTLRVFTFLSQLAVKKLRQLISCPSISIGINFSLVLFWLSHICNQNHLQIIKREFASKWFQNIRQKYKKFGLVQIQFYILDKKKSIIA